MRQMQDHKLESLADDQTCPKKLPENYEYAIEVWQSGSIKEHGPVLLFG